MLGDRPFTGFCLTHTVFTLVGASKFAVLPIVVRDLLHGPQWIASLRRGGDVRPTGTATAAAAPRGAEGRASSIFQLPWGLPVALAPGLPAVLLSASNALPWSVLALTCAAAVPTLLVLRKKLPEALR
ncbi:hypothetical protein [Amycolatopsis sp. NPDC051371]|uniref:hypothetical protein n=1 Tax=Amycolatopsis sp. NPDC051371 TaxID=3155800 RepID=UPI00342EB2CE